MTATTAASARLMAEKSAWCPYPVIYEINTWIWLTELARKYGRQIDLSAVPEVQWDAISAYGFDAVWLMGVWERSPAGITIANQNKGLLEDFRRALHDFRAEDNVGSPYCVRNYVVDRHLGGPEGLAIARDELAKRGMKLVLDFVPNHVAPDHPWVITHPEYFIRGTLADLETDSSSYLKVCDNVYACGRDPYFPAWPDVLQLNAFESGLRQAVIETVSGIAEQCDGIRCDMAMLLLNSVFERTWGGCAGSRPATEYWVDVISATKQRNARFLFVAEAYWDLEWELQQLGFDFCYDKKLYDRMEHSSAEEIRLHLCAEAAYQNRLIRFIENHDEPRAAATFSPDQERAVALAIATLPGAKLFYEGQFEGRKVRPPVFLGRRPDEHTNKGLQEFYTKLMKAVNKALFREGQWSLCERFGWADNASFQNIIAWNWMNEGGRYLIAINLSDRPAQARIRFPWPDLGGKRWQLIDHMSGITYERDGNEMLSGLYVEHGPWDHHLFECVAPK